jgi:hypothetical protein
MQQWVGGSLDRGAIYSAIQRADGGLVEKALGEEDLAHFARFEPLWGLEPRT